MSGTLNSQEAGERSIKKLSEYLHPTLHMLNNLIQLLKAQDSARNEQLYPLESEVVKTGNNA